jgi:hypothetical protein
MDLDPRSLLLRLTTDRADLWVYNRRGILGVALGLVFLVEVIALVIALAGINPWPHDHAPPVTVSDQTAGLLATGTAALAYAALIQVGSAESRRIADYAPHIVLDLIVHGGYDKRSVFVAPNDSHPIVYRVRNLGPGNALSVRVRAFSWMSDTQTPAPTKMGEYNSGSMRPPLVTSPMPLAMGGPEMEFNLAVNEERSFKAQVFVPPPPGVPTSWLEQLVVTASCLDVEGRPSEAARIGTRLEMIPRQGPGWPPLIASTLWRVLTRREVSTIPLPKPLTTPWED